MKKIFKKAFAKREKVYSKIAIVGESGVGKTSIAQRYVNHKYDENVQSGYPTKLEKKVNIGNDIKYKFEIWDVSGGTNFRDVNRVHYADADIIILVYDVTERKSFEELENFWIKEIKKEVEQLKSIII